MRGRKPKPLALRLAGGNAGHRPLPEAGVKLEGSPAVPPGLSAGEREEWDRTVAFMEVMGTLSADSGAAIEIYVRNLVRMRAAEAHLAEHGVIVAAPRTGLPVQNPHLRISERAAALVMKTVAELGLTPSAHSRVQPEEPSNPYQNMTREELLDEYEQLSGDREKKTKTDRAVALQ